MDWTIRGPNLGGGEIFPFLSRPALGSTQPSVQWVPIPFPGIKRPGRSADDPSPSSTVLKERLVLYLYSPSGPSQRVLGLTLPLLYFLPNLINPFPVSRWCIDPWSISPTQRGTHLSTATNISSRQIFISRRPAFSWREVHKQFQTLSWQTACQASLSIPVFPVGHSCHSQLQGAIPLIKRIFLTADI